MTLTTIEPLKSTMGSFKGLYIRCTRTKPGHSMFNPETPLLYGVRTFQNDLLFMRFGVSLSDLLVGEIIIMNHRFYSFGHYIIRQLV
jgi:hypothetical protein